MTTEWISPESLGGSGLSVEDSIGRATDAWMLWWQQRRDQGALLHSEFHHGTPHQRVINALAVPQTCSKMLGDA